MSGGEPSYALSVANLCEGILLLTTERAIESLIHHWEFNRDDTPITTELYFLIQKTKNKLNKLDVELYDLFIETISANCENIFERCSGIAIDDISESLIEETRVVIETTKETETGKILKYHTAVGKIFLYSIGYTIDGLDILDGTFTPLGSFLTTMASRIPKIKLDKELHSALLALQKISDYEDAVRYLHALHSIARTFNIIFPGIFSGFHASPTSLGSKFQLLGNDGLVVLSYLNNLGTGRNIITTRRIKLRKN